MNFQKQPPEMFCKKGVLRNFAKFTGKHLCQNPFFNKVVCPRPATSFKKETLTQVFSCEFLRTPFSQKTSGGCFQIYFIKNEKKRFHFHWKQRIFTIIKSWKRRSVFKAVRIFYPEGFPSSIYRKTLVLHRKPV